MNVDLFSIDDTRIAYSKQEISVPEHAGFVLLYTSRDQLEDPWWLNSVQRTYPGVPVVSCSTSGEIYDAEIMENSISALAVEFEKTEVNVALVNLNNFENSFEAGKALADQVKTPDLTHLFISSDGWLVDGAGLIDGMYSVLGQDVTISGGMAGDGANFAETLVGVNSDIKSGNISAIAFYGDQLSVGFGTHGGWNEYGPEMTITRSSGRVVYELNGQPALELYKTHLGHDAIGLPGTALLYPVSISLERGATNQVRTVYNIDEHQHSIILGAGASPNSRLRFMKAQFDDPLQGVEKASLEAQKGVNSPVELAIVVSCIGRKLLFGQDIQQEISISKKHLGAQAALIGFYSYGEVCPVQKTFAELHQQMITITAFSEG